MKEARLKTLWMFGKYLSLVLGLALFVGLIREIGWEELREHLRAIGWGMVPFVIIHAIKEALSTSAWQVTFPDRLRTWNWWQLYCFNWAGAVVTKIYPAGFLGGETLKVFLVRQQSSTPEGVASILIARLAQAVSQVVFIFIGIFFLFYHVDLQPELRWGLLASSFFLLGLVASFAVLQRKGFVGTVLTLANWTPLPSKFLEKLRDKTFVLDDAIRTYHLHHFRLFWWAVGLYLLRQILDLVQIELVLYLMGVPGGFERCWYISLFSILVNQLLFFVPGRIGVQEGGKVLIATALGMLPSQGLTLGLVSRFNQIIWTTMGLVVILLWQGRLHYPQAGAVAKPVADLDASLNSGELPVVDIGLEAKRDSCLYKPGIHKEET